MTDLQKFLRSLSFTYNSCNCRLIGLATRNRLNVTSGETPHASIYCPISPAGAKMIDLDQPPERKWSKRKRLQLRESLNPFSESAFTDAPLAADLQSWQFREPDPAS